MAVKLRRSRRALMEELRYEPTEKHVRATLGDRTVADTKRAVLVWEPRRVLPSYAVPADDLDAELSPASTAPPEEDRPAGDEILHGGHPFGMHTTGGEALDLHVDGRTLEDAAFRPADPELEGLVVLDFHALDTWYEEDEPIVAHPRDPYHRVDIRRSSRHVRMELDGELLAESSRPHLVFETGLPVRFYLPREDIRVAIEPTEKRTYCAYKGEAHYMTLDLKGGPRGDLLWTYPQPLPDAGQLKDLFAFFDEKVETFVDGERWGKPTDALGRSIAEEAGV